MTKVHSLAPGGTHTHERSFQGPAAEASEKEGVPSQEAALGDPPGADRGASAETENAHPVQSGLSGNAAEAEAALFEACKGASHLAFCKGAVQENPHILSFPL